MNHPPLSSWQVVLEPILRFRFRLSFVEPAGFFCLYAVAALRLSTRLLLQRRRPTPRRRGACAQQKKRHSKKTKPLGDPCAMAEVPQGFISVDGVPSLKPGLFSEALVHLDGCRPRLKYPNCCNGCDYDQRGHRLKHNPTHEARSQQIRQFIILNCANQAVDLALCRGPDILPGGVIPTPRVRMVSRMNAAVAPRDTRHLHRRTFNRDHSRVCYDVHPNREV
jgi:hypothetical protein